MGINSIVEWCVFLLGIIPFLILATAALWTQYYRMKVVRGQVELSSQPLPLPVRFYGWSVRKLTTSLIVYLSPVAFMFLIPFLLYSLYWPEMLTEYIDSLQFWAPFIIGIVLILICAISPDKTGGIGVSMSSTTSESSSDDDSNEQN